MNQYKNLESRLLLLACSFMLLSSCTSLRGTVYAQLEEEEFGGGRIYSFNKNKAKLLIYIEGSGLNSVLGIKKSHGWEEVHFSYFLSNTLESDFSLAIPEKLNFQMGKDYSQDSAVLRSYTVERLTDAYVRTIDAYLDEYQFHDVYILGISEGGLLAPAIYNELAHKAQIKKLVIWGAGGHDQAECFRILASSPVPMPEPYRNECRRIDEVIDDIKQYPDSINKYYLGWPYTRWSSFFKYQPVQQYSSMDIPVLFIQGMNDFSSPVESVQFIEDNVQNDAFEYRYYENMGHIPEKEEDIQAMVQSIYQWLRE